MWSGVILNPITSRLPKYYPSLPATKLTSRLTRSALEGHFQLSYACQSQQHSDDVFAILCFKFLFKEFSAGITLRNLRTRWNFKNRVNKHNCVQDKFISPDKQVKRHICYIWQSFKNADNFRHWNRWRL